MEDKLGQFFIYKITNLINNKIYIGQTNNSKRRWRHHKKDAQNPIPNQIIGFAIKKYGVNNFTFQILENEKYNTREEANLAEERIIEKFNARDKLIGYNIRPGGNVSNQSQETKEKIRQSMLKLNIKLTEEAKEKLSKDRMGSGNPMFGTQHSKEHKEKISNAMIGDKNHFYGKEHTEETKQKISQALKGKSQSEETKKKKSKNFKGKTWKLVDGKRVWSR